METIRCAGFNERRCISRDILGLYGRIVTIGTYTHQSHSGRNEIAEDTIIKALKYCINKHPVLCTIIRDSETEKPQLGRASRLDLEKHLSVLENEHVKGQAVENLQHLLEKIHNEPLVDYEDRPQWCIYIAPSALLLNSQPPATSFDVALATSHALADGMSGMIFHRTFLQALQNADSLDFDANPVWTVPPGSNLPPALDKAAHFPISWSFLLRPLLGEFLPATFAKWLGVGESVPKDAWCGAPTRPERSVSGRLVPTAVRASLIPEEVLLRALEVCRSHRSRLTALLNHLVARALAQSLTARGKPYSKFPAQTAVDLRRCLPGERRDCMANYVSGVSEVITTSARSEDAELEMEKEDWQAMQQSTKKLGEAANSLSDQPIALLRYLSNFREWTLKNATLPAKQAFGMSNLGSFEPVHATTGGSDGTNEKRWAVEQMIFSQSANGTGEVLNFKVASAKNGALAVVVTWWPGMLGLGSGEKDEEDFVDEVLKRIEDMLERLS